MRNTTLHKAMANSTATRWKLRGCGDHRGRGLAQVAHESVESATHIMAMGLAGSLDDAFRTATANMAQWLTDDYKLTPSELAQVLGT